MFAPTNTSFLIANGLASLWLMGCGQILGLDEFTDQTRNEASSSQGGSSSTGMGGAATTSTTSNSTTGAGGAGPATSSSSGASTSSSSGSGTGGAGGTPSIILAENDAAVFDTENFGTNLDEGQSFKLPAPSTITAISIRGSRGNMSQGVHFHLEIRVAAIDGEIQSTTQFDTQSVLPPFTTRPDWVDLQLDQPLALAGGAEQYFIRVFADDGDPSDELRWSFIDMDTYPDGRMFGGPGIPPTYDHNFRVIGHSP